MPNWCNNTLYLKHEDTAMIKRAIDAFNQGKFLSEFYPEPDYSKTAVLPTFPGITGNNDPVPQDRAWWDWRVQHWGTKWDVGSDSALDNQQTYTLGDTDMSVGFESAWSPPIGVMEKLTELGFDVQLYYMEEGCAFCGCYTSESGDNCHDLPQSKADLEHIPKHIIEELDLVYYLEQLKEYEMEN